MYVSSSLCICRLEPNAKPNQPPRGARVCGQLRAVPPGAPQPAVPVQVLPENLLLLVQAQSGHVSNRAAPAAHA
ncbi:hypothetical protein DPMN_109810 [Dreissena polymorpha]|uniref:Uncharacterized protein n=1 Tax=Dreissena polymorpha TaxID=45954 RepID=A0A9D4KBE6_DREPO|nr:hypothetical protein DPMN_109810 [Dreissena polymorpha]